MNKIKDLFREGWIMLNRPFQFAELTEPLQKLTVLYAYTYEHIYETRISQEGLALLEECKPNLFERHNSYVERYDLYHDEISKKYEEKIYKGTTVECYIQGKICRFHSDEYSVISEKVFNSIFNDLTHFLKTEDQNIFDIKSVKDKIFYLKSRGIDLETAKLLSSTELKDSVYFKPTLETLSYFADYDREPYSCRILPDKDYGTTTN